MGRRKLSDEEREKSLIKRKEKQHQYFKKWYWSLSPEERKAINKISNQRRKERWLSAKSTQEYSALTQEEQGINARIAKLKKKSIEELIYVKPPKESERVYR